VVLLSALSNNFISASYCDEMALEFLGVVEFAKSAHNVLQSKKTNNERLGENLS